jgi:alpha-L-fucosidase
MEVTPFVFRKRLYRLENFVRSLDFPGAKPQYRFHEDGFRIRDIAADRIIGIPLLNHYFAIAFTADDRVYVYAGDYEESRPWWHIRRTVMIASDDLVTWTKPQVVLEAEGDERLFNYAVCRARGRFFMLYETDDRRWPPPFTLRFCESDDLVHWRKMGTECIYGTGKYTGGPALYYDSELDWFYCLYLDAMAGQGYETRIARSHDFVCWEEAPPGRPVVTFDPRREIDPARWPGVKECSASDVELCEFQGKTHVYWINGNQQGPVRAYQTVFDGSAVSLLRKFFEPDET